MVFDHRGRNLAETTPLIVKYIHKGNIHYLVEKQHLKKKFAKRRPHISKGRGGQQGVVKDHTFIFFGDPSLNQ